MLGAQSYQNVERLTQPRQSKYLSHSSLLFHMEEADSLLDDIDGNLGYNDGNHNGGWL